ncbi:hypothetical protein TL16_g12085 [Triparma laevis f. inornata]|uniref:CYRIA/CYRIB Rac1 binding domain-containing protein n=2 Tax=Triparma laevis TaxID=1534972 RepID=A0A9W7FTL3_9STRA|nr:hypothetical protein TL16_g12085 [Triparma laevis f. inornata]GMI17785.1 hypothetical protein TrLO_g3283 [Triparma laevis f. longispina]
MGNFFDHPPTDPRILEFSLLKNAAKSFSPVSTEIETHITDLKWMVQWLDTYHPCLEPIRLALSSPNNAELQQRAFEEMKPNVINTEKFYTKAKSLSEFIPLVLASLEAEGRIDLDPYLTRQFLQVLQLMYMVDQKKMMCPGLQNDFSFYRRTVSKFPQEAPVNETTANQISMWIAEASPLSNTVSTSLKSGFKKDPNMVGVLSKLANMSAWIVYKDVEVTKKQKELLMVAMVQCVIMFDRSSTRGAFHKDSGIMLKKCVSVLTSQACEDIEGVRDGLKNGLKYSTVHFGDVTTPAFVEEMLS